MTGAVGSSQSVTRPTAPSPLPGTPLSAQQSKTLSNTGLAFAKSSLSQDAWIDGARSAPKNSQWHAQYTALVNLSGGQKHNAALKVVLDRYQASLALFDPNASASDRQAAQAGWADQLMTGLKHLDPFTGVETLTAKGLSALASNPEIAKTPWGKALAGAAQNAATVGAFQDGIREGVWEGGKSLVTGIAGLAGQTVQYLGDSTVLGNAGDALRGITGKMPDWVEAAVPSSQRGQLSDAAIGKAASNAFTYLNTHTPQQAGADIGAAIGKAWDGLRADHAKAAAGGPAAEARWWGKTAGRAGFEVAATFVPVAGVAGKISKGAKAAELGLDAVRGTEVLTDAGRVAGTIDNMANAGRAATLVGRVIERTVGQNSVKWVADAEGRLVSVSATFKEVFTGLTRSADEVAAQGRSAAKGIAGDHGGHAAPHRFVKDQGEINMFPQNGVPVGALKNFNGSAFKTLENELADWVQAGGTVKYDINFSDFVGDRPGRVGIEYRVFNDDGKLIYDRTKRFENKAGQTYDRLSKENISERMSNANN